LNFGADDGRVKRKMTASSREHCALHCFIHSIERDLTVRASQEKLQRHACVCLDFDTVPLGIVVLVSSCVQRRTGTCTLWQRQRATVALQGFAAESRNRAIVGTT
jgi:hypothetical protein